MKRMSDAEVAEAHAWIARNGGPQLPLDLHEGGVALMYVFGVPVSLAT